MQSVWLCERRRVAAGADLAPGRACAVDELQQARSSVSPRGSTQPAAASSRRAYAQTAASAWAAACLDSSTRSESSVKRSGPTCGAAPWF